MINEVMQHAGSPKPVCSYQDLGSCNSTKVFAQENSNWMFNPHQRCGYSDMPFARIHYFYTAGFRNGLEGVDNRVSRSQNHTKGSQITKKGFDQKLKGPKWVCPSILKRPPPFFKQPIFAIFGRASGQIFEKIRVLAPLGLVTLVGEVLDSGSDVCSNLVLVQASGLSSCCQALDQCDIWLR